MKAIIATITLALASCTFPVEVSFKSKTLGATYSEKGGLTLDVDLPATISPAK